MTRIERPRACVKEPCHVRIAYEGSTQTITDEQHRVTTERWEAFGDPSDPRLASLTDADQQVWSYTYHALGGLAAVDPPGDHGTRTFWRSPSTISRRATATAVSSTMRSIG